MQGFADLLNPCFFYEYFDVGLSVLFKSIYVIMDPDSCLLSYIEQGKKYTFERLDAVLQIG